jgi:shikimate dehydrogenase
MSRMEPDRTVYATEAAPESLLRVGLIGDPVAHSYSSRFQQAAFDALNIAARYELWRTDEDELAARVASLLAPNYLGANVTIPYKEAMLPLLDIVDPLATRIGAVNTIVHREDYLYGYNTDAPALLRVLAEHGIGERAASTGNDDEGWNGLVSLKGYTAVLLGAGGAARGAAFALVEAGVERLIIVNRTLERAQRLAADVQQGRDCQVFSLNDPDYLIPHPRSIIINATSVGMERAGNHEQAREEVALPAHILERFNADTFVLDMVYRPAETRLLIQSRILGLRAVNGLSMLLHQGALAFTLWTRQPAPLDVMQAALG